MENIRSVAILVLNEDGQPLIVSRKSGNGVCMPGGKVDPGEGPPEAARRELREETGLTVTLSQLVLLHQEPCQNEDGTVSVAATFLASRWQGPIQAYEPELNPRWGSWEDLCFNSPFGGYNLKLAREGFLPYLSRAGGAWSPTLGRQLDAVMQVLQR